MRRAPQPQEPDEESTFKELKRQYDEIRGLSFPAQWSTKKERKFMKTLDEQLEACTSGVNDFGVTDPDLPQDLVSPAFKKHAKSIKRFGKDIRERLNII